MTNQHGHTRGELYVDDTDQGVSIKGEEHNRIVAFLPGASGVERKTAQVNAQRLVICWNELEGIPTDLIAAYVSAARNKLLTKEKQQ